MGETSKHLRELASHSSDEQLASHILQLVFVGSQGFRFPVAYFATSEASPTDLDLIIWKTIDHLNQWDFEVSN